MKTALEKNKKYSNKYVQKKGELNIPQLIKTALKDSKKIIDLGCGYGHLLQSIQKKYPKKKLFGVEISPVRVDSLKENIKGDFKCADVCKTGFKDNSFDLTISTQVIEHLSDDKQLVEELSRITKKNGHVYVTSVIKKPGAIYKYRNNGKFVLDPTHEKEYKNKEEFLDLFKEKFKLIKGKIYPVKRKFLGIELKIPGYYIIEGLWIKK